VIFVVQKRSGAKPWPFAIRVAAVDEYAPFMPQDIRVVNLMNASDFIRQSLRNVTETLMWGGLFVTLTTFVFLRTIRASLVIVLTIPFSLIIAFFFMFIRGWTINIISLSSLSVASAWLWIMRWLSLKTSTATRAAASNCVKPPCTQPVKSGLRCLPAP
jgi:HAE1 family hydrophobic/amphiphilic exporter-1